MKKHKFVGGGLVGMTSATYPFVTLIIDKEHIQLNGLGFLSFKPQDILCIEKFSRFPVLGAGIRIIHTNTKYNKLVVFKAMGSRDKIFDTLQEEGWMKAIKSNALQSPKILNSKLAEVDRIVNRIKIFAIATFCVFIIFVLVVFRIF